MKLFDFIRANPKEATLIAGITAAVFGPVGLITGAVGMSIVQNNRQKKAEKQQQAVEAPKEESKQVEQPQSAEK